MGFLRFHSVQEYSYVLDFNGHRAKFSFTPRCQCYGFGHLRAIRVTAISRDQKQPDKVIQNLSFTFAHEIPV